MGKVTERSLAVWVMLAAGGLAHADNVGERLGQLKPVGPLPRVDALEAVPLVLVSGSTVAFAPDARMATDLTQEGAAPTRGPMAVHHRVRSMVRSGTTRVLLSVDGATPFSQFARVQDEVRDAGAQVLLLDASQRPLQGWFTLGLNACRITEVAACVGKPELCQVEHCVEPTFHVGGSGTVMEVHRAARDGQGPCVEKQVEGVGQALPPWHNATLAVPGTCPSLPAQDVSATQLAAWVSALAPHKVCPHAVIQAEGKTAASALVPLLRAMAEGGFTHATLVVAERPVNLKDACASAIGPDALNVTAGFVNMEVLGTDGRIRSGVVLEGLHGQRPAITACYDQARMIQPEIAAEWKATLRIKNTGRVLSVRLDGVAPQDKTLRTCLEDALKAVEVPRSRVRVVQAEVRLTGMAHPP